MATRTRSAPWSSRTAASSAHCYRMLGSLQDAEDALQETLLRAWRGLGGFETDRALRPWLYKIATNASLDALAKRPKRTLRLVGLSWPATARARRVESIWIEPYPDEHLGLEDGYAAPEARYEQRESVELAFIAALQHLPARQRAVLILREVLGFSAREVAQSLDTTAASVNSALSAPGRRSTRNCPSAASRRRCARSATSACRARPALRRGVGEPRRRLDGGGARRGRELRDAAVPALVQRARHRDRVHGRHGKPPLRYVLTRAGGQPAVGWYMRRAPREVYLPTSIEVLALEGERVRRSSPLRRPRCSRTSACRRSCRPRIESEAR